MARKIAKTNVYTVKLGRIVSGELEKEGARVVQPGYVCTEEYANKINESNSTEFLEIDDEATKARSKKPKE